MSCADHDTTRFSASRPGLAPGTAPRRPAVLFPGQGSQAPDMRERVARHCPELLARCIELVGEDPFPRVAASTRFQQPAIFLASWAGWVTARGAAEPVAAAGHSLGELTALAAAGVLSADDALRLVVLRGRLMADADARGSMVALLGASAKDAATIAARAGVSVANDNAAGQIVLAGDRDRLASVATCAAPWGIRVVRLPVAGAFHSPAMAPAVAPFRAALEGVALGEPRFPVFSSSTAGPFADVRGELAAALVRPVRWRETMLALHDAGARAFVDVGPGRVLAGLARRTLADRTAARLVEVAAHA